MKSFSFSTICLTLMTIVSVNSIGQYDETCSIQTGTNGVSVDTCDGSKKYACINGRCACQDSRNQIYHYKLVETNSRNKRGTKKKIAIGVGAAAVGVYAGSKLSNAGRGSKKKEFRREYACYSRVGGSCVLNFNNINIVTTSTTTTTTTVAPVTNNTDNSSTITTTTTASPIPQAQVDINSIPKCVPYASCEMRSSVSYGNFSAKIDGDPRIGICKCDNGFTNTKSDICVKSSSNMLGISTISIILSVFFTKMLL